MNSEFIKSFYVTGVVLGAFFKKKSSGDNLFVLIRLKNTIWNPIIRWSFARVVLLISEHGWNAETIEGELWKVEYCGTDFPRQDAARNDFNAF